MANVLTPTHSVFPYDMLLTTIFQHFDINWDGDTNILVCKPSDAIDNSSVPRLDYEPVRNPWVLKTTRVFVAAEEESDKEVDMDIPHSSPTVASLTIVSSLTTGAGSLAALSDYASAFQNLFEHLDTISLDV